MTSPYFGYQSTYPNDDITEALGGDFSKVGFCSTSEDADASAFPLNKLVRFTSNDPSYLAKLGSGHLKAAVTGLNDQLGNSGADIGIVRVAAGSDSDPAQALLHTMANITGDAGLGSGLWALRNAPNTVGAAFHIWQVPGYTYQQPGGIGVDNPVRAALAPLLEAAKAVSMVDVDATSKVNAIAARNLMSSKRMMPIGVAARVYETVNGVATLVTRPMSSRIAGLIVATDNNYRNGLPFDTWCNKAVLGIADINRPVSFDLGDGSTEAQLMLASDIGVVVKGNSADAGAIADGGFVFLGIESAATDNTWSQMHQVRGADYIDVQFAKLARRFIGGRYTPRRGESLLKSFGLMLDDHVANEDILGYRLECPPTLNSVAQVRLGQFNIRTRQEQAPAIRVISNEIRRYPEAIDALVAAIAANAGSLSAVVS